MTESRAEKSIRWAVGKWEASGARELSMPEPGAYMVEGRVADKLYLGPDEASGWAIVQDGRVLHRFADRPVAWEFYKRHFADPHAAKG